MLAASAGEAPPEEPAPSAELLMYLGEFEDAGGEFVDPLALERMPPQETAAVAPAVRRDRKDDDAVEPDD